MFYLAQAGSSLQAIETDGTITTLTLPSGVTIDAAIKGRFAILKQQVLFVYAGTISLWVDPRDLTVRPMHILQPLSAPTVAAGSGTGLTGNYRVGVAYGVKNIDGVIVNRSPVTGPSLSVTLSNKDLSITDIPISPSPDVNCRILYRTAAGGTDLFELIVIDDNDTTAILNTMSDTLLADQPADPNLGVAPGAVPGTALSLLVEWKSRLWGVSARYDERDDLIYTEVDQFYGWNPDNSLPAYPKGEDSFGVTGLIRRRDSLGICKRNRVLKVIGSSNDDFEVIIVHEAAGCVSADTIVVIRDKGYFLGLDGVYRWDDDGVVCISRDSVDPWFTTDDYFNRSRFPNAFAGWNPLTNAYELCLANLGDSTENRWVSFHIDANGGKGEWLGPHTTSAFTPSCRARLEDDTGLFLPCMGGTDGYIYKQNQSVYSDISGSTSAIGTQVDTKYHSRRSPDTVNFWGQLSVLSRIESGGSLMITPYVGRLNATAGAAISHDLTTGRERLRRLGVGPLCKLSFTQNTAGRRFLLYGYEISPIFEVGRR